MARKFAEMRVSPDGRNVAVRNRDDRWYTWRVSDGSHRTDQQVDTWLPLALDGARLR